MHFSLYWHSWVTQTISSAALPSAYNYNVALVYCYACNKKKTLMQDAMPVPLRRDGYNPVITAIRGLSLQLEYNFP